MSKLVTTGAAGFLVMLLAMLCLQTGCNRMKNWRESQIQTSHRLAEGYRILPPDPPIKLPSKVRREIPWDDSQVVIQYSKSAPEQVTVLSAWDATKTTQWLVSELVALGYSSEENASMILDGASFRKNDGTYHALFVDLELNTQGQCTVAYKLSR